jgi:hypothetical protein
MNPKPKISLLFLGSIALLLASWSLRAADQMTRLDALPGSKMRLEGTSSFHDWEVQSPFIGGSLEVGSNFPMEPGQSVSPGKVEARGQAYVPVAALRSTAGHDTMDDKMHEMLKQPANPKIVYHLSGLVLKEVPKDKNAPYVFDSTGELAVAGVTNKLSMPVSVLPLGDKKFKITGSTPLKMTDFGVQPASILFAKTGDDVTIKFDWMVGQKKPASAAANK